MGWRSRLVSLIPNVLVRWFAGPYIAGNSLAVALQKAQSLWQERGLKTTLDLLGEGIRHAQDVDAEVHEYLAMIEAIQPEQSEWISISLKPTQMGLAIDPELCQANLEKLLRAAQAKGLQMTLDMEESTYTDATLSLYRTLRSSFTNVGTVLQSRLFRTEADIDRYLTGLHAHIRLCLGIYIEPADIAYTEKPRMKENFLRLARKLWEHGHFVAIATHDEQVLEQCLALAHAMNISPHQYEVQMLLGVPRDAIQQTLCNQEVSVRLYVPYGVSWSHAYAYARRRLVENPSIALYVARNLATQLWHGLFRKRR